MKQQHFDEFCELLDTVSEQYGKAMTPSLKMLYWQGLHDEEFEAVREALFRHIRNTDKDGDYMPKVSNIRKMIDGSTEDSSLVAWAKVDKALRQVGTYQSVVFDDPIIHRVVYDMGGWVQFGTRTEDEWPFVGKEFQTRYRGFKSRGIIPEYQSHLIGLAEAHNSKEGYRIDPPSLLGNPDKAKEVMNKGLGQIEFNDGVGLQRLKKDVDRAVGALSFVSNKDVA